MVAVVAVVVAEGSIGAGFKMGPRHVYHVQMSLIRRDNALATCTQSRIRVFPSTLSHGGRGESSDGDEKDQKRDRTVECPKIPLDFAQVGWKMSGTKQRGAF